MKKINKSISKEYLPVKIYIDDIEKIASLFSENNIKYSVETNEYKYDDFKELIESLAGKDVKSFEIKSYEPYITIEFNKMWAKVYVSSDDTNSMGLFYKLDSIINDSKRLFSFAYSYYFIWILNGLIITKGIINNQINLIPETTNNLISALLLFWVARVSYIRLVKHSSIRLIKKEHELNFFQRKRDDLILAFISALVGAILGVVGTLIVNKLVNS